MPTRSASDVGRRPDLVLLHGVGVGPRSFDALADLLEPDHRVLAGERPGGPGEAVSLSAQADAVAEQIDGQGASGACVLGVSGGATVALVLALEHPEVVGSLIVHEPLVGHHAPGLHARFARAAAAVAQGDAATLDVLRSILGDATWEALGPTGRAEVEAQVPRARAEVPVFAAFDPTTEELVRLAQVRLLTTIGSRSHPDRREAAEVLASLAGAEVATVEGAGNVAQLDAPDALAALVRGWLPVPTTTPTGG